MEVKDGPGNDWISSFCSVNLQLSSSIDSPNTYDQM